MRYEISLSDADYNRVRLASMKGKIHYNFKRIDGVACFYAKNHKDCLTLCKQLERIINFGATSARELFGIPDYL